MTLTEYQKVTLARAGLVSKTQIVDPITGELVDWDNFVAQALEGTITDETLLAAVTAAVTEAMENAATDEDLAAAIRTALESIPEVGDTFITNVTENNTFITNITSIINDKKNQNNGIAGLNAQARMNKNQLPEDILKAGISYVIDGGGSAITTGAKGVVEVPFDCTIDSVALLADQSGSIVVDIWKDTYANFPPTDADSITASAPPTLSSAAKSTDSTLTGWTKALSQGDVLKFNVDSASTVTNVSVVLRLTRT